jgi:hypothetical protein
MEIFCWTILKGEFAGSAVNRFFWFFLHQGKKNKHKLLPQKKARIGAIVVPRTGFPA